MCGDWRTRRGQIGECHDTCRRVGLYLPKLGRFVTGPDSYLTAPCARTTWATLFTHTPLRPAPGPARRAHRECAEGFTTRDSRRTAPHPITKRLFSLSFPLSLSQSGTIDVGLLLACIPSKLCVIPTVDIKGRGARGGLHGKPHGLMSSSQCSICQQELDRHAFSAKQLKNAAHRRKCLACVAAEESAERARIAATQRAEQLRKQELAAWVDANVTEPSTSLSEWTSEIMDATPHADVGTQSTAPFVVGSPGPPAPARRKGGRPPKATEDKAVRGYLWRCRLKSADDGGYDELQASLSGCPQITKLAMRRSPADSECIEAFAGFSGDRSNVQLSKLPGLPTGVQWERVIETRQGGEWSSVKADSTFSIMLPKEDAVESVRRGLQHELRVQPAWVDTHVPALSRVEAGAPILSPEGRHASRTISADVPTPSGEHVERREAQVDYDVPAAGGNAGAAARDSQRLREERALLSLDTAAEACERQQHREAEQLRRERQRCRRDELKALRDAREQILELLLARAQILKPGVGLERWARLVNLPCRTDTPSGRAVREVFFRKLRRQSSSYLQVPKDMPYSPHDHYHQTSLLLPQGVSSNVGWLCTLIHSLQSFTKWMHNTQELQCPLPPWVADAAVCRA